MSDDPFTAADAKSSAAVDLCMGKAMTLLPWEKQTRMRQAGPDVTRPAVPFRGTYGGAMGQQKAGGDRAGNDMEGRVQTKQRSVTCDFRSWPTSGTKGDRIRVDGVLGAPTIEIVQIDNDGVNRVIVKGVLV
jgi:hypothetical protein